MVQELLGGIGCAKATTGGYEWDLKDGRKVELRVWFHSQKRGITICILIST